MSIMERKIFLIDVDNTICRTQEKNYKASQPNKDVILKINQLFDSGHTIRIFTGRGSYSGTNWREFTAKQLQEWGVKYHVLLMGKPHCDFIVDDKSFRPDEFVRRMF